jgi:hypothetical protein
MFLGINLLSHLSSINNRIVTKLIDDEIEVEGFLVHLNLLEMIEISIPYGVHQRDLHL